MSIGRAAMARDAAGTTAAVAYRLVAGTDVFFRVAAIAILAEFVVVFISTPMGLLLHALALIWCAVSYLRHPAEPSHRVLIALALVPISRLLGLTMPLEDLPRWTWYALAGAPLLAGAGLMASRFGLQAHRVGFRQPTRLQLDVAVVAGGFVLGSVAGSLDAGPSLITDSLIGNLGIAASLVLFVALPEEVIFRGLLQPMAHEAHGAAGIVMVTLLYAATFLTSFSAVVVLVMGIAGAAFAWSISRGGSLWGTITAHAILVIGAALVWPAVLA